MIAYGTKGNDLRLRFFRLDVESAVARAFEGERLGVRVEVLMETFSCLSENREKAFSFHVTLSFVVLSYCGNGLTAAADIENHRDAKFLRLRVNFPPIHLASEGCCHLRGEKFATNLSIARALDEVDVIFGVVLLAPEVKLQISGVSC